IHFILHFFYSIVFFFSLFRLPPRSTFFPYTTLFRSSEKNTLSDRKWVCSGSSSTTAVTVYTVSLSMSKDLLRALSDPKYFFALCAVSTTEKGWVNAFETSPSITRNENTLKNVESTNATC